MEMRKKNKRFHWALAGNGHTAKNDVSSGKVRHEEDWNGIFTFSVFLCYSVCFFFSPQFSLCSQSFSSSTLSSSPPAVVFIIVLTIVAFPSDNFHVLKLCLTFFVLLRSFGRFLGLFFPKGGRGDRVDTGCKSVAGFSGTRAKLVWVPIIEFSIGEMHTSEPSPPPRPLARSKQSEMNSSNDSFVCATYRERCRRWLDDWLLRDAAVPPPLPLAVWRDDISAGCSDFARLQNEIQARIFTLIFNFNRISLPSSRFPLAISIAYLIDWFPHSLLNTRLLSLLYFV